VGFAVDGLQEQVQNCGLLVPANEPDKLAEAIASLPQQDLTAWGEAARASVVNAWAEFLQSWSLFLGEVTT